MMKLPLIDWEKCVELVSGNKDLAKNLLELFFQHLPLSHNDITSAYDKKDFKRLSDQLHKLYGACCYCAVPTLTQAINQLSEAIKTKQEVVLEKLFQNLNQEIEAVKREYGKWSEEVL